MLSESLLNSYARKTKGTGYHVDVGEAIYFKYELQVLQYNLTFIPQIIFNLKLYLCFTCTYSSKPGLQIFRIK